MSVAVKSDEPMVEDVTVKVAMPDVSEGPEGGEIASVTPRLEDSVTVLPATGVLLVVFKVTVIKEVLNPSAGNEVGAAVTVELVAEAAAVAVNVTVAVCVMTMLSVVLLAVKNGEPIVEDFTAKVTTPFVLDGPEAAEIVSVAPRLEVSDTVLFETALLLASFSVAVMVEVVTPSAGTEVGRADTVEPEGLITPAVKVTVAVWVMTILSVVAVA